MGARGSWPAHPLPRSRTRFLRSGLRGRLARTALFLIFARDGSLDDERLQIRSGHIIPRRPSRRPRTDDDYFLGHYRPSKLVTSFNMVDPVHGDQDRFFLQRPVYRKTQRFTIPGELSKIVSNG